MIQLSNPPLLPDSCPVWLLDVDGVINASRAGWSSPPHTRTVYAGGFGWKIRWAPQLIQHIRALDDSGLVTIQWATSWIDVGVQQLEIELGLPSFPLAYLAEDGARDHRGAKTGAALEVVRSGHRLIWTDDEAIPAVGPEREELDAAGALLIAPSPSRGLRPEHLAQIEELVGLRGHIAKECAEEEEGDP